MAEECIERNLASRNQEISDVQRIELRISISLGDVFVEGSDLYGNGVNVAARKEGLAEPTGICVSGSVQEHVGKSLDIGLVDLGEQFAKNIENPIRAYKIDLDHSDQAGQQYWSGRANAPSRLRFCARLIQGKVRVERLA